MLQAVKGLREVDENTEEVRLVLAVFLTQDSEVETLFTCASSTSNQSIKERDTQTHPHTRPHTHSQKERRCNWLLFYDTMFTSY